MQKMPGGGWFMQQQGQGQGQGPQQQLPSAQQLQQQHQQQQQQQHGMVVQGTDVNQVGKNHFRIQ